MRQQNITTATRQCIQCLTEYEATTLHLLGAHILRGAGRCPGCVQKILEKEQLAEKARLSGIRREWRIESGIPPKFLNQGFETFDKKRPGNMAKAWKECLDYANGYPIEAFRGYRSLLLFSLKERGWDGNGVGKTHLACAIAHCILNRWNGEEISRPIQFISEPELYRRIQATYSYSNEEKQYRESEQDIITDLIYRPLLILDDIGKEKRTDPKRDTSAFIQRTLFAIINGRYNAERPMVLTTNMDKQALRQYLGTVDDEATFDRLWEMCRGEFFQIKGESYRRKV